MNVFIPGAELIGAHAADAEMLKHREPAQSVLYRADKVIK